MADLFFRNPRLLQLTLALIVVSGLTSYSALPRTEDPRLTKRNSLVTTLYPGANAEQVESLVTDPIEDRLEEIEEIYKLESTSRAGVSVITIEVDESVPARAVDEVWARIRDKVGDAQPELPAGALPSVFNDTDTEVDAYTMIVALVWEDAEADAESVRELVRSGVAYGLLGRLASELSDGLRAVPASKQTKVFGAPREEVLVRVVPERLADLGLSAEDVAARIAAADSREPAGRVLDSSTLLVEVGGRIESLERIREIPVVAGADGRGVRVADIGRVEKTVAEPPGELAVVDGKPAVVVAARMQGGRRIDEWAEAARAEVERFRPNVPRGVRLETLFDQSLYVDERLVGLQGNLVLSVALVMGIVLFTMGWRSALLVGSALPISALMALTGMRFLGVPIHQMSVTGLIVALGLLIDNAIVMVDEVRRRLDEGMAPAGAVGESVRHLAVPLLGSTLTTVFAFLPIGLMPGGAGEFVGPIAFSVILALLSSLFAALTIVPALTGVFAFKGSRRGYSLVRDGFQDDDLGALYRRLLGWAFARPRLAMALAAAPPLVGFLLQPTLQEQFFPPADRNQFQVQLRLPMHASLGSTLDVALGAREVLLEHPQVESVSWFVGQNAPKFYYNMLGGDDGSPFYGQALVSLNDNADYFAMIRELQARLDAAFPSAQLLALQLEQGPPFQAPIEMHVSGPDLDLLGDLGDQARAILSGTAGLIHTLASLEDGRPKALIEIDDDELRLAGFDNTAAARQLQAAFDGRAGGSLIEGTEQLPVRVVLERDRRAAFAEIPSFDLIRGGEARTPVAALGKVTLAPELAAITHREGVRVNTIRGYIQSGLLPSVAQRAFQQRLDNAGFALPPGYRVVWGGEAEQRDDAVGDLLANVSLLAVLMTATLVLSFNSFRLAGLIGAVAGLSMGYAFLMLAVFRFPFGFVAIVGSMGLIGVAVNDSIVVLAALREDARALAGDASAVLDVVARATRHVVTTTFTTMVGFAPLLVNGGDFWPPLAITLGGGVAGATVLALVFVPAWFLVLARRERARRSVGAPVEATA